MKNRTINTYGLDCLKEILGDSFITKGKIKYFVYNGEEYQLKVSVTDLNSNTNNFNQMETINMAIHILGIGTLDSEIDWMLVPVTEVARLSYGKKSQHGGLVAEDFIATLEDIDSSFYVKPEDLKQSIEKLIEKQNKDSHYKLLESRMAIERILKDNSKRNYESFLNDFVANLP
jgi:hypothetical protein